MTIEQKNTRGAMPLENNKKEAFCKLYANDCWGNPAIAVQMAGFCVTAVQAVSFAEELFDDETVRDRIRYLRDIRTKKSLADTLWIRETLTAIAVNAVRDADRIRALNVLAKIIDNQEDRRKKDGLSNASLSGDALIEQLLPLFEGEADGYLSEEENEKSAPDHLLIE